MIALIVAIAVGIAFTVLIWARLRSAHYPIPVSRAIVLLSALQLTAAFAEVTSAAVILALILYLLSTTALEFAENQNVRSVMALGGSLAMMQAINPLGGILAVGLVPLLLSVRLRHDADTHNAALLLLLLFIPISSALVLIYISRNSHLDLFVLQSDGLRRTDLSPINHFSSWLGISGSLRIWLLIAAGTPIWLSAVVLRTRGSIIAAVVPGSLVVLALFSLALGRIFPVSPIMPAFAGLCIAAFCMWPAGRMRNAFAISSAFCSAAVTWLSAAATQ